MVEKYKATYIGLLFTAGCFLLYYTFLFPLLIVLPVSLLLEVIFKGIYPDQGYAVVGHGIIISLAILFAIVSAVFLIIFLRQIKELQNYKTGQLILYMALLLFIIHPLVFYIDLSNNWGRASDGQFILSLGETFQLSSLPFLILGIALDSIRFYKLKRRH